MTSNRKPIDAKLKVKPVFPTLIHNDIYEGPCRAGNENALNPERERVKSKELFGKFQEEVKENLTPEANILEAVYIEHKDDWFIKQKEFQKLETDLEETDLYLIGRGMDLAQFVAVKIGERYKKPIAMVGGESDPNLPMGCDAISHSRATNLEGYVLLNYSELNHLIFLLRVRKSLKKTRILRITENKFDNVNGNFLNPERLIMKFGMDCKDISISELVKEMDKIVQSKAEQKKVEEITDKLIKNAQKVHMKRGHIINSVNLYLAVKNLMEEYRCNAFTVPCFELCPDGRAASQRKAVPCLAHTLLKDEGIPSACGGDINVLLAITFLMYVSKKSVYMGNIYMINRKRNIMAVLHDVPGIKMKGLAQPDLPYEIRNFTYGGWGATIRYDFSQDSGQEVTIARFNPLGNGILVTKGEIVGCEGFNAVGCTFSVLIRVSDVTDFFHKAANFGNHCAMVYGDYI